MDEEYKKAAEIKKLTFEQAMTRLEEIVRRLEEGEIPLEESLEAFQEGMVLSRYCRDKLTEVEFRVDYLLKEEIEAAGRDRDEALQGSEEED